MRTINKEPTKKELWGILEGIFKANPHIESVDSNEDVKGVHMKLVLKKEENDAID